VHNAAVKKNKIVAVGFYGKNILVGYGSKGGWDAFGVDREVTKSSANILYELDGKRALDLYKQYLGTHAENLPASALLFPLEIKQEKESNSLVRTVLAVNEKEGSMTFAGDIPQGSIVRMMKANFNNLIEGASTAAENASMKMNESKPDLAILISCVGRKLVLKQRAEEELENAVEIFDRKTTVTGFYSYGEICPTKSFDQNCDLHNQTMTITTFKEI
jgi:hypothetical protein